MATVAKAEQPAVPTPAAARPRGQRKVRVGIVVSDRMQKTIVVRIRRLVRHPKYGRTVDQQHTFKVHDEANSAHVGDWVKIMETRPISKDKRWRLVAILRRASTAPPVPSDEPAVAKPGGRAAPEAPLPASGAPGA